MGFAPGDRAALPSQASRKMALNADAEGDYDANDERIIELVGNGNAVLRQTFKS